MIEIAFENVSFHYPGFSKNIFNNLTCELPNGVISFVGQNGFGKSTLLLLGGGVLLPTAGKVIVHSVNTEELRDEEKRHRYAAFIYQNMEFETETPVLQLLFEVYGNGFHDNKNEEFIRTLIRVFELESCLQKRTQEISKGELQRTILAFSLLYGSKIILMDEPIFALEDYQKKRTMEFLLDYSRREGISIYYSVHELAISELYSDYVLLFRKNAEPLLGVTSDIFTRRNIEEAYEVPLDLLKRKESLYRDYLLRATQFR